MMFTHVKCLTVGHLIAIVCFTVGCQSNPMNPVFRLEKSYWFDQDRGVYQEFDLEGKDILGRRFFDKQDLYLGSQEFTRKSDGKRYGVAYHADLTWEALQINIRGESIWIISHLESELRLIPYRINDKGRQVYSGSVGVRISLEGDTNSSDSDRPGHS